MEVESLLLFSLKREWSEMSKPAENLVLCPWICSSISWFIVYGNVNRICTLLLCENHINLITLNWFIILFRSTAVFCFSVYSFYYFLRVLYWNSNQSNYLLKILIIFLHILYILYIVELYVSFFYIFQVSCNCVSILS